MRTKRNIELLLLLAGLPPLIVLFATALINGGASLSVQSFSVPLSLFGAFIIAHLAVRKFAPEADPALLPITLVLSGTGIIFVMRLAPDLATKQIGWLALSIFAMILVLILARSLERLAQYKYTIMLLGLAVLLLPAFIGVEHNGSRIWLSIGDFSFQPGEIAKVLIVLFLASYLTENREMLSISNRKILGLNIPDMRTLLPLLIMWGLSMLIVALERDLGSALLFFGIFLIMLYVCTGRFFYVIGGALLVIVGITGAYAAFPHVRTRVTTWLDPFADAQDRGYQLVQAIYSMADGGLFGTGIGRGMPTKIPVVESDFIFAAIAEEMGLLGAAAVLILYLLFTIRGFLTAARAKNDISAFCAVGLTSAISFQAFVIVGGVTRLIPLTGLTLPFMSQGGSSLLASFIILALLLRAGDEGTGLETEMISDAATAEGGVLGRYALGKRLTSMLTVFALLFAALIANLTYIQVIKASDYQTMPSNNHTLERAERDIRGSILTSDGTVLAESEKTDDGTYKRYHPEGTLAAHLIGYSSSRYGLTGLEASQNDTLTGNRDFSTWSQAVSSLAGASTHGNDVVLTIDKDVQEEAESQLSGVEGAAVVLDPTTGAVLALASSPTYDPDKVGEVLDSDSDALFNRATQALYAPGSTFKILTLAAAIDSGKATPETTYPSPAKLEIGGGEITNFDGESFGTISLKEATAVSSNTVFGKLAADLGAKTLVGYSRDFGFNTNITHDLETAVSLMPDVSEMSEWETAWAGIGQPVGQHKSPAGPQATVVQMALVGAAVANGGVAMRPYVVEQVLSPSGENVSTTIPEEYGRAVSKDTAKQVMDVLLYSVENGSGAGVAISGVDIAGKTGTAQTGADEDNAWFVGIAPADKPKVVVAICVEHGGTGSSSAVPRAREILRRALEERGLL